MLRCRICDCICDPSDLRCGVCDDCRERQEKELEMRQEKSRIIHAEYKQMEMEELMFTGTDFG